LEQALLEQPGEAELVGRVLDLRRLALACRRVLGELLELVRCSLALAELAQQRTVDDEVGVAADRRGEVAVGAAPRAGMGQGPRGWRGRNGQGSAGRSVLA